MNLRKDDKKNDEMRVWYIKVDVLYDFIIDVTKEIYIKPECNVKPALSVSLIQTVSMLKSIIDEDRVSKSIIPENPEDIKKYHDYCLEKVIKGVQEYFYSGGDADLILNLPMKKSKIQFQSVANIRKQINNYLEEMVNRVLNPLTYKPQAFIQKKIQVKLKKLVERPFKPKR